MYSIFEGEQANQASYLQKMGKDREWGDNFTLLALAQRYDLTINVIQDDGSVFKVHNGGQSITLGYIRNVHYVSTKKL